MKENHRTRKLKLFCVTRDLFKIVFNAGVNCTFLYLPVTDEIPDGAVVESVHEDWTRDSWVLVVSHDSYPEVPEGQEIPFSNKPYIPMRLFRRIPVTATHEVAE